MQVGGAVQGASTVHPRRRLNALLVIAAVLAVAAVLALLVWVIPLATSEVGSENATQKAGTGPAVVHDDAGNMPTTGAGSAAVHDDAGDIPPGTGTTRVPGSHLD
ncbi:MAG TPA: hypothetical protein VHH10_16075 [Rubrobacteraceae bacterium]|nr:hypothetical protein [Rubrobacteraceae bacterium]